MLFSPLEGRKYSHDSNSFLVSLRVCVGYSRRYDIKKSFLNGIEAMNGVFSALGTLLEK